MAGCCSLSKPATCNRPAPDASALSSINVESRARPSDEDLEKQKVQMKTEAIKAKQFELREAFMKSLKQTGSVVVNDRVLDQISQG